MNLTETERWTIINALTTAAERYEQDAQMIPALARGFTDQATQARALAAKIEEEED